MSTGLEVVFGGAQFGNTPADSELSNEQGVVQIFDLLKSHNCRQIDSARLYGASEEFLGRVGAGTVHGFTIDTKWVGGFMTTPSSSREQIVADAKDSLAKLGIPKVNIFYMHSPDTATPVEDTLAGINEAYQLGLFRRFGLSNYSPAQVQEIYDICKREGFILPTVYQGLYSAVNRKPEEELLPLLRSLDISFYAYSPLSGGFLTKTRAHVENGEGRFNKDQFFGLYRRHYANSPFLDALDEWNDIAADAGVTKAALAYRWVSFHGALNPEFGDAIIIGASSRQQLEQTLESLEAGPLDEKTVQRIEGVWDKVKHIALVDNFQAAQRS